MDRCRSRVRGLVVGPGLRRPPRCRVWCSRAGYGVAAPACWLLLAALSLEYRYQEKSGRNAAKTCASWPGALVLGNPITGIAGCCARAASGHAIVARREA